MPKYIILAPIENSNFVLPPLQSEDGLQLQYMDGDTLRGGYSAIGDIPQADMGLVLIDTTLETLAAMIITGEWTFIEEVLDADVEV